MKYILILLLGILFTGNIFAGENLDVVTTISVGTVNMQLDIAEIYTSDTSIFDGDTRNMSINPTTPGTEIGLTVLDNNLYYGFIMFITGLSVAEFNISSFDVSNNSSKLTSNQEITSRTSYSIYAGYSLLDVFSLYGGLSFGTASYGREVNIDEFGPFIGGRYALRFGSTSSFNFDLSYSFIETDVVLRDENFIGDQHTVSYNNNGLSFSITWLKALDRGRSFVVKANIMTLELKGSTAVEAKSTNGGGTGTATIDGTQDIARISLGMGF